ncbi:methylated-DNA--[protein]-cysteine S-methyltransferase [Helicobacter cappadocius]|uniref:methylated-DNA--[protein]-cysteine S-methyltransferase n=1 Tax=Helicobacter cappadocius TaxID=3063998 RepID=A0AA90PQN3_9HELI|nr:MULTISPECIES: methylated-DNA--[protein]-cysteine S-methyltransferase [unclassified Helicobacter]MDO7252929.1 methylated-DNA--[protein]-cysteine S-methyltransferase [Helicobacter sp. faydin-H75]MDP2539081.1 methylated-DNA--[protein]-cysteine S-methyltransferase [Helicobacter sp. faydin-H76]
MNNLFLGNLMYNGYIQTPKELGKKYLHIQASHKGIKSISFCDKKPSEQNPNDIILSCIDQLQGYFKGTLFRFDVPLDPDGSAFAKKVWERLCDIKFGEIKSYKQVALELGGSNYSRAIGSANSRNPIFIIIPCHRVIANNGSLSGYAGGVEIKKWLLDHEKNIIKNTKKEKI